MRTRVMGVVAAFGAILVVFATVVFAIAAIQDYQENKGQSFIERAASMVGIGTLVENEEPSLSKIEIADDDIPEPDGDSYERPEIFRFFGRSEDNEGWLDDFFDREWLERDDSFRFEDRIERLPGRRQFEGVEELPFDRLDFEGLWQSDWVDELVERGWMTEEDADEFKSWFDDLPKEFEQRFPDFSGDHGFEFDSDDGRFRFRWRWDGSDDGWFFETDPEFDDDAKNGV